MSFIKLANDSFIKRPVKNEDYKPSIEEIDAKLVESLNTMSSAKKQIEDIQATWKSLREDAASMSFFTAINPTDLKEQFQKAVDDLKIEYSDAKATYNHFKELKNKALLEADLVLKPEELYDPADINLRSIAKKRNDEEKAEQERIKREQELQALREKADDILQQILAAPAEDQFEEAFSLLVPASGKCETVAGEMIRAMMKIRYRDLNDGDLFYQGYGLETCAAPAAYLAAKGFEEQIIDIAEGHLEDDRLNERRYTAELEDLERAVMDHIINNPELIATPNSEDMLDADYEWIKEYEPRYEFEFGVSETVQEYMNRDYIDIYRVIEYVEDSMSWDNSYEGAEVSEPWSRNDSYVTVKNLTIDGKENLEQSIKHHYWDQLEDELKEEFGSPEDWDEEDEDSDDEE